MTTFIVRICKADSRMGEVAVGFLEIFYSAPWNLQLPVRVTRVQLLQNWSEKGQPNAGECGLSCANSKELDIKCQWNAKFLEVLGTKKDS